MVFQNYALYPHLTVYENIAFPLRLSKKFSDKEIDEKVREASKTLELDEHLERKPGNLSGGQRQRVAMGRAIVRDAKAFLFDEPLSNLDAKLRGQMRTEISRLQKSLGITTVYVTHDQTEAMTLGDRVAVLKRGVLQQLAGPRELYEQPVNLFVAGFIGSPPMNFMPATVKGDKVELPFATVDLPEHARDGRIPEDTLLIAGIRPEYFEDASVMDASKADGATFHATIDVVEWLGNEAFGYIPYEAPPEVESQLEELAKELDSEALRTQIIVALDSSSRIRDGEEAELHVNSQPHAPVRARLGRQPDPPHGERGRAARRGLGPRVSPRAGGARRGGRGAPRPRRSPSRPRCRRCGRPPRTAGRGGAASRGTARAARGASGAPAARARWRARRSPAASGSRCTASGRGRPRRRSSQAP